MRSKLLFTSFLLFFIFVPFTLAQTDITISAETPTPRAAKTPRGANLREETRSTIEANKEEMIANREQKRIEFTAVRKEKITSRFNQMQIRIQALIERLQNLIDKIDARIVKIDALEEENKIDTTVAKNDLALATSKLLEVKLLVNNLSIDNTLASDTPKETFTGVSEDVKLIKDGLKEVHALLIKIITDLKGLRVGTTNEE